MVLLTGATGFLGSFVLDELLAKGFEVVATFRAEHRINKSHPRIAWVNWDLSDPEPGATYQWHPMESFIWHLR